MNNLIHEINGFFKNDVYYGGADSLFIKIKYWDKLDKAGLVGKALFYGKNDYKCGRIFY